MKPFLEDLILVQFDGLVLFLLQNVTMQTGNRFWLVYYNSVWILFNSGCKYEIV